MYIKINKKRENLYNAGDMTKINYLAQYINIV